VKGKSHEADERRQRYIALNYAGTDRTINPEGKRHTSIEKIPVFAARRANRLSGSGHLAV
jgi:hypothetical protein